MSSIGIYGGTFDPIHVGHVLTARHVKEKLGLSGICFVPAFAPPLREHKKMSDWKQRLAMLRLALKEEEGMWLSDCEESMTAPTYTVQVIEHFRHLNNGWLTHLIIGSDLLSELHQWHRIGDLLDNCQLVVMRRPGAEVGHALTGIEAKLGHERKRQIEAGLIDVPQLAISSSVVRLRASEGLPIRHLVPDTVRTYITSSNLYG